MGVWNIYEYISINPKDVGVVGINVPIPEEIGVTEELDTVNGVVVHRGLKVYFEVCPDELRAKYGKYTFFDCGGDIIVVPAPPFRGVRLDIITDESGWKVAELRPVMRR